MTQPNDLPPLPLLPSADGAYNEDNGAWSDTYHVDKMRAYATAYGLQCAEAAVERYAAKVREAVTAVAEKEKAIRSQHTQASNEFWKADYAAWTCIEIKNRLLDIR